MLSPVGMDPSFYLSPLKHFHLKTSFAGTIDLISLTSFVGLLTSLCSLLKVEILVQGEFISSALHIDTFTELTWLGSVIKNLPAMQEMQEIQVLSLGQEDPIEKGMAIHFSILVWRVP